MNEDAADEPEVWVDVPDDALSYKDALLMAADAACRCDGAAYMPEQRYPFIVHPDCPRHGSPQHE